MSRRLLPWVGGVVFLAVLAATPVLWDRLDRWVQAQREALWSQVEAAAGHAIEYDRIGPSVLAALDFQNVRLTASDGSPLVTAASIRVSLDWVKVLEGRFSSAVTRIQVINASLGFDSRRDQALLDHWASFFQGGGGDNALPRLDVEFFNLAARWTDGTRSLGLDRGFVVLAQDHGRWELKYRGALRGAASDFAAAVNVRGELRADDGFRYLTSRIEVTQTKTSWFDVEPVTLQISMSPSEVRITKVADRVPLDLQASWDRLVDRWTVRGAAEGFVPGAFVHLKTALGQPGWPQGAFTGRFSFQPGGDIEFSGRASWAQGVLPAPLDQGPVVAVGTVKTHGSLYRFEGFQIMADALDLGFTGDLDARTLVPQGEVSLGRWVVPGVGTARGRLTLTRDGNRVVVDGSGFRWNGLGSDHPQGWVEHRGSGWAFSLAGPWDQTDGGRFAVAGGWDPRTNHLSVSAQIEGLPVSQAVQELQAHWKGVALPTDVERLWADLSARIDWSPQGLAVTDGQFLLQDPVRPGRSIRGTLAVDSRMLQATLDVVRWDGFEARAQAQARFHGEDVDWTLGANLLGRNVALDGRWNGHDGVLTFGGAPGVKGAVRRTSPGAWAADLTLDPLELVPGWTLGFHLGAQGAGDEWSVEGDKVTVTGRYPWNQEPFSIRGHLFVRDGFVRWDDLVLTDARATLVGNLVSTWNVDFAQAWSGRALLATPSTGRESLDVLWSWPNPQSARLTVRAGGLDLARSGWAGIQGRVAVAGELNVEAGQARWSGQMSLSEARWGEAPLGFRASVSGDQNHVSVRSLNVSVNPVRIADGSLDVDWSTGGWTGSLGLGVRLGASDWTSTLAAGGTLGTDAVAFQVKGTHNSWGKRGFPDWDLGVQWTPSGWSAALSDRALVAQGFADGRFEARAQAPLPVAGQIAGQWREPKVTAVVQDFRADLSLAKEFVNTPAFAITGGAVTGTFTVEGTPLDPEVNGNLVLQGFSATSSFVRRSLGPVDIPVVLEGHRVTIAPVNVGPRGKVWLVSGAARLDHFLPEEYQLMVQMDPLSEVPFSYQMTGIAAEGGATGLLVVRGTPLAVTLGGRLVLQDTTITLKDSPATPGGPGALGFNADLTLVTGRKVEFLWPNESVPLLRAVGAPNQSLVIKANDVASTWSVVGTLGLKTGEVNYLSRTFVIKEGQLGFQESQAGFDPRINVRAEWRYRETSGTTIVSLKADGALSKFSPRFEATPYKSAEELNQLVGTTLALPSDYTKSTSRDTALSLASDVGTSFLLSPFEETVKKNFNLDLFTVKTEILKKSLLGRNAATDAADYLDNTRLFFGKYVGDDLFLQGTLAFRQDDTIAGQANPKMVVEPEFQMEFQTPFFLLNWTLLPLHPETLFVTDNTVTFRWNWSY